VGQDKPAERTSSAGETFKPKQYTLPFKAHFIKNFGKERVPLPDFWSL